MSDDSDGSTTKGQWGSTGSSGASDDGVPWRPALGLAGSRPSPSPEPSPLPSRPNAESMIEGVLGQSRDALLQELRQELRQLLPQQQQQQQQQQGCCNIF